MTSISSVTFLYQGAKQTCRGAQVFELLLFFTTLQKQLWIYSHMPDLELHFYMMLRFMTQALQNTLLRGSTDFYTSYKALTGRKVGRGELHKFCPSHRWLNTESDSLGSFFYYFLSLKRIFDHQRLPGSPDPDSIKYAMGMLMGQCKKIFDTVFFLSKAYSAWRIGNVLIRTGSGFADPYHWII
jgi:hypothetical protein